MSLRACAVHYKANKLGPRSPSYALTIVYTHSTIAMHQVLQLN